MFLDIDDGWRLSRFTFHENESHEDPVLHVYFHTCSGCSDTFRARLFHSRCFEFQRRLRPLQRKFLAATQYSFRPASSEVRRRSDLIKSRLPPKLCQTLPVMLPPEILAIIAGMLMHECAVVTAQEQVLQGAWPSESLVDLARDIYARYQEFDGLYYVTSLRNHKLDEKELLVLNAREEGTTRRIIIAQDHLGVRLVQFASSDAASKLRSVPGAWWKDITRASGITKIRTTSDVSRGYFLFSSQC